MLERIFAPIRAIGSIPDALYDAIYEKGNIANVFPEYGKNLLQGLGTTFLGNEPENQEQISDILMEEGYLTGEDAGSKVGRVVTDIAGGIALDPLTYVTFGASALADDVARQALTPAVANKFGGLTDDAVNTLDNVVGEITEKTVNEALPIVQKRLGQEGAEAFYSNLLASGNLGQTGALNILGKKVSESPKVVETAKNIANPLRAVGKGGMKVAEKVAPEATRRAQAAFYDVFDPLKAAAMTGREGIAMESLKKIRNESNIGLKTSILNAELKKLLKEVPENEKGKLAYLIQATTKGTPPIGAADDAFEEVGDLFVPLLEGKPLADSTKQFIKEYSDFIEPITKKIQDLGGLERAIDPATGLYLTQQPVAYTEDFIKERLLPQLSSKKASELMRNPKVLKELRETGEVGIDTIDEYIKGIDVLAGGQKGLAPFTAKSTRERVFDTITEGEKAGVVYETDIEKLLDLQTTGQLEQLSDLEFGKILSNTTDSTGRQLFLEEPTKEFEQHINLPGVGSRYTDSNTKRVLENYFDEFSAPSGLDKTLEGLDKVMGVWKGLVTGKGPGALKYQLRNAFDDNLRMVLDGANLKTLPKDYSIAQDIMNFNRVAQQEGMEAAKEAFANSSITEFLQNVGKEGDISSFWKELIDNGTLSDIGQSAAEAGLKIEPSSMVDTAEQIFSAGGRTMELEQLRRVAYYVNQLRKTGSTQQAAEAVRRTLFNYMELSKTERDTFKRIFPFYSFLKNNIKFQFNQLFEQPGKYAKFVNVLDGLQSGMIGPNEQEWEAMPEWLREKYGFPVGMQDGNMQVLSNLGLSFEDIGDIGPQGLMSKLNPLLKLGIEGATGQNTFMRQPIQDLRGGTRYETHPLRGLLGYQEYDMGDWTQKTVDPYRKYAAENIPFLSTLNTALQQAGRIGGPLVNQEIPAKQSLEGLVETVSPAKVYDYNVESAARRRENEKLNELYELLYRKGISDQFTKFYIPADIRDQLMDTL
jgi:hypothetical protein